MVSTQAPHQPVKLTKTVIDRLTPPERGQRFVRDRDLQGFAVRITASGARSFIVEKRINGRVRRITLGRYGELTCEQARRKATAQLGEIAMGADPVAERHNARLQRVTLREAYRDFRAARKALKASTLRDYNRLMDVVLADWAGKPVTAISKSMVARKHAELGQQRGEYYANLAMRFLRAVLNFSQATYQDRDGHSILAENPVSILTQTRAWYRQERRQTVIKAHALPAWYAAVRALPETDRPEPAAVAADYLTLLLFTGLRAGEAAALQWSQVDLSAKTLTINDPKNREPLTLPLSKFLAELLRRRAALAVNAYVFPGRAGVGHVTEVKRQVRRVVERSGVPFTLHDLRRTFITVAEALDIPAYAIKRLVNHSTRGDVTAGYIVTDVERLRGPMQRISDYLVKVAGIEATPVRSLDAVRDTAG